MILEKDDEREEELAALECIWPEMVRHPHDPYSFTLELKIKPQEPVSVRFNAPSSVHNTNSISASVASLPNPTASFSQLPPLTLHMVLPQDYPESNPPEVSLSTSPAWLPAEKIRELEGSMRSEWEDMFHSQVLFAYIDKLQTEAEHQFGYQGGLVLDHNLRIELLDFAARAEKAEFDAQTFDCGVCLEPKKGAVCYKLSRCGHIFCKECLVDFYTNCITEGDVNRVQCMDPGCGIVREDGKKMKPTIAPSELLQIPLDIALVQRYAEMKRKKKMELDKSVVYCPRSWCQAPARSEKYPILPDLSQMTETDDAVPSTQPEPPDSSTVKTEIPKDQKDDRLRICEKCHFAFCQNCLNGWHGTYQVCYRRGTNELSEEDQASYDYIRKNTTPCPVCYTAVQKSAGCNHMTCFQCMNHFCYLCSMWLDPTNPYKHFNKEGRPCHQRLWDLFDGDEGNGQAQFVGARHWEMADNMDVAAVPVADLPGNGWYAIRIPRHVTIDGQMNNRFIPTGTMIINGDEAPWL